MLQFKSGHPVLGDIHKPHGQFRGRGLPKLPFYYIFSKSDHEGGSKIPKNLTTWYMDDLILTTTKCVMYIAVQTYLSSSNISLRKCIYMMHLQLRRFFFNKNQYRRTVGHGQWKLKHWPKPKMILVRYDNIKFFLCLARVCSASVSHLVISSHFRCKP